METCKGEKENSSQKEERQEVTNNRPLSILNIPGKLLEGQMCEIIDKHMEDNELISDKQWGFPKGRSTIGLLLQIKEKWKSQIDRGYVVGIIFIDFQKAFNTVLHDVLFLLTLLLYSFVTRSLSSGPSYPTLTRLFQDICRDYPPLFLVLLCIYVCMFVCSSDYPN